MNVSLIVSGMPARQVAVADLTLQSLLDQEGFSGTSSVTHNGVPTSNFDVTLAENDSIFITRSNKGGRM